MYILTRFAHQKYTFSKMVKICRILTCLKTIILKNKKFIIFLIKYDIIVLSMGIFNFICGKFNMNSKKDRNIYINKKDFYQEMLNYKESGKINNNLGKMFMLLAKKNAKHGNFCRYFHADLDDMKTDAVIACISALPKYDFDREDPFSYFTSVVLNAFKYYLKRKYKNDNFRMKLIREMYVHLNKPFTNEIQKDINETKKSKNLFIELED